ncbi:MAG: AhpC/TSA family protein [Balneolaceae bacterium]|nr:AhpC/TSA family protein [Balneolaceae bacterium]
MRFLLFLCSFLLFTTSAFAQNVPDDPYKVSPLLINSTIPDVTVKTIDGSDISLLEVVKEKPTVFVFYRGGWCPYCSRHMAELAQIEDEILEMGFQIVGVSVDRPEVLRKTMDEVELDYMLLSDSPATALKAFGIAYTVDQATVDRYKGVGIDLEANAGYNHHILPVPAVYFVDQNGNVDFQYVNPNYKERISGEILRAAAKTFMDSKAD